MKYIALLRGINISEKNKIAMPKLKSVLGESGFKNVVTYLNSGNVIFECDADDKGIIRQKIKEIVRKEFRLEIPILILIEIEHEDALNNRPKWWDAGDKEVYNNLIFIIPPANYSEIYGVVGEPSENIDKIENYKNYIFWSFDLKNYKKSNWWIKTASNGIKDKITFRTANTIKRVLEICKK